MNLAREGAACQSFAVRGERHPQALMLRYCQAMALAAVGIPDAHRAIHGTSGDCLAVGSDRDAKDALLVSAERLQFLARGQVPAAHRPGICDEKRLAVR